MSEDWLRPAPTGASGEPVAGFAGADAEIDLAILAEASDGDEEFETDLLVTFVESTTQTLQEIRAAIDAGDSERLERSSHFAKGGARSIGAMSFAEVVWDLELAGREARLEDAAGSFPVAVEAFDRLSRWIAVRLDSRSAA